MPTHHHARNLTHILLGFGLGLGMLLQGAGCAKKNRAPVIEEFDGSPPFGEAPLDARLWWTISDPDGDALTCKLDLDGDGHTDHTISNCTSEDVHSIVLEEPGRHHVKLTVSDGKDSVSRTIELYSNQCIFRPETVWPERETTFGGATVYDSGQVDLLFHSATSAPIIENGTILWGTSAGGYLRRVTSVYFVVSPHGKRYELQTEEVKLEEAVETCKFGIRDYQMRFTGADCKEDCDQIESILPFVGDDPGVKGGVSIGHTISFSKINLGEGMSMTPEVGLKITIERAYLDVEFLSLNEFTFEATPEVSFSSDVEIEIFDLSWDQEWPLSGPIYLSAVPIGPLIFTPVINLTLAAHAGLEPTLSYGVHASFGVTGGVSYVKDEGTTTWGSATKAAEILQPSVELGIGSVQVGLKKRTSFLLFGLIGPYVGGHVYVKGDLTADLLAGEVCLNGSVGADSIYGININLFLTQIFIEGDDTLAKVGFYHECLSVYSCGNGNCDDSEDCVSCPQDCQTCPTACGDSVLDPGETCDPPAACPEDVNDCDDGDTCTEDSFTGAPSSCDAECLYTIITACTDGDGCCPTGCDTSNDNDCSAACGNGVLDPGETCDPPSTCPSLCGDGDPCTTDTLTGSAANCNAVCHNDLIFSCTGGDGCCPVGCDSGSDSDCSASCGNGVVDAGETCDPPTSCPSSCYDADDCTSDALIGDANMCTAQCLHNPITSCSGGDSCCPSGCNAANDSDCSASCGNGICEPGEGCGSPGECEPDCGNCTTDPCDGYIGYYCGATGQFPGGTAGTLYYCSSNVTQSTQSCTYGCVVAPVGSPDYCDSAPVCLEYGDACGASDCCDQGGCVSGWCCLGSGTGAPGDACGSGNDCCSGHCHMSGLCCWNPDPPGCIL